MKNKKGFTLVELLSVIVLLGIVITIGIFSIGAVRNNILEKQYKNVKEQIEEAAEKYYQDTGSTKVNVQLLINEGYLKADNKSMIISDPRDGSSLNCFEITINNNEKAVLGENKTDEDGSCIDVGFSNNGIKIKSSGTTINGWYKEPVVLTAVLTDNKKNINDYKFVWKSDLNPNILESSSIYDLTSLFKERGNVIDDEFYVTASNETETLNSMGTRIRIDGLSPVIKKDNVSEINNTWSKTKTLIFNLTDEGSGIYGYILSENNCESESIENFNKIDDNANPNNVDVEVKVKDNGDYYFCVIDKAGNKVKYNEIIKIEKIDKTPPDCDYVGNNIWTNKNVKVKYGCKDEQSGCESINGKTISCNGNTCYLEYTYTKDYMTANIKDTIGKFTIKDNVGNERKCPINKNDEVNVYLDKTKPNVKINNMSYSGGILSVDITINDNLSGINNANISYNDKLASIPISSTKTSVELNIGSISGGTVKVTAIDNAGNEGSDYKNIELISGTVNGNRLSQTKFEETINIEGNVLDYNVKGDAECNKNGKCIVTPSSNKSTCIIAANPKITTPNCGSFSFKSQTGFSQVSNTGVGYAMDNYGNCHYYNKYGNEVNSVVYKNSTGSCAFNAGDASPVGFSENCDCDCVYDSHWKNNGVVYCSKDNSSICGAYGDGAKVLCIAIKNEANINDSVTGVTKGVTATKTCKFTSFEAICSSGTKSGSSCYLCQSGYNLNNSYECQKEDDCYKYSYTYNYYVY